MQFFGLADYHFTPLVGVVQVPCPLPLPIAVAPHSAHPLPQLAVHRSSRRLSASAKLILQIYEPPQPRSRSRRVSRSSPPSKTLNQRGSTFPPAPFRSTKSWPNDIAKVDIDTPTKELAELAFRLEDKLLQEIAVDNSLQISACRNRRSRPGYSQLANEPLSTRLVDHPLPRIVNDTINFTALEESTNWERSSTPGHQPGFELSDGSFQRLSGPSDSADVLAAEDPTTLQLDHATSFSVGTHLTAGGFRAESDSHVEDQQPLALADTALSIAQDRSYVSAWVETAAITRSSYTLDNEARFSMVMEVLSSETLYVRRRAFDEDLWSFTSAGTGLHDPAAIAEISQQAFNSTDPRREWLFRTLHDRAFYQPRRRRGPRRDVTPLGRRELRKEAGTAVASGEEDETERDTEEEAAKAMDRAEEAAKEREEEVVDEAEQFLSTADEQDEQPAQAAAEASSTASTPSSHTKRPSVSEATERPSTPSSEESSHSIPPEYRPEWMPVGRDRMGFEWWFLVDEDCNLHWSFRYADEGGHQVFLPRSEHERVLRMRRRTAALELGRLSVVREEEG
ncbi:hypothetical protein CALVIDRAFT_600406 [Calocera viscosa TUFC12733]|uniref:Uncharacterized protein n=1 Tax=Calocera viscosa (strain TUFC12733) TaxID=1330018 RepID=A0A167JUZ0_CALVF|nr:hypothetical protein CALVIDRAFT_600406 [Calocera viscosa TUFC12733]